MLCRDAALVTSFFCGALLTSWYSKHEVFHRVIGLCRGVFIFETCGGASKVFSVFISLGEWAENEGCWNDTSFRGSTNVTERVLESS